MSVFCVGCSWTIHWPKFIPGATWEYFDGCGLWAFGEAVEKVEADTVVVQLPTPIRSHKRGKDWVCRTRDLFVDFVSVLDPWRNAKLLQRYKEELKTLNRLHPNVLFFEFNTAGYPFRSPYDFGESCSAEMADWARENRLQWLRLNLSEIPGMCLDEVPTGTRDEPSGWSVIEPIGVRVLDGHPNETAQRLAAGVVMEWLGSSDSSSSGSSAGSASG